MSAVTGNKVFAPAIFFIAFRESLEAALVIGILTGMLENVVGVQPGDPNGRALVKRLRKYIFLGAGTGLGIAFAIGAAFLAIFYTQTTDLYGRAEELWEGIFNLIAILLITPMSLAILRADRSRAKWRKKLVKAFEGIQQERKDIADALHVGGGHSTTSSSSNQKDLEESHSKSTTTNNHEIEDAQTPFSERDEQKESKDLITPSTENPTHVLHQQGSSKNEVPTLPKSRSESIWAAIRRPFSGEARGATAIFVIPMITTLREGLEGVVFIGGVSLGLPATSIPLPAIVGLFCGLLCGFIVFKAGSFNKIRFFLVFSTAFLLVIAAGMFSRSVYYLQFFRYVQLVGDSAAESGSGPGSYDANNYVWHLDCCNPEDNSNGGGGWAILNSLFGWNNTATIGSILSYIFYWLVICAYLIYSHFQEKKQLKLKNEKKQLKREQRDQQAQQESQNLKTDSQTESIH